MPHSDYIVYVDESGDHGLTNIDPHYPVFVLAFCIVEKEAYIQRIVPAVQRLKFDYFGHDMVVLREADIRKSRPPFDILMNSDVRVPFYRDLNALIDESPFTIVASAIRKTDFRPPAGSDGNPYHVAMEFGLERVFMELQGRGQRGRLTHIVFERRGRQEDEALELEFRRIMDKTRLGGMSDSLDVVFAHKQANSAGLQLADMVARPIGRRLLAPDQPNRAWDIVPWETAAVAERCNSGLGTEMLSLKSKRPRRIRRGPSPTGHSQSHSFHSRVELAGVKRAPSSTPRRELPNPYNAAPVTLR